MPLAGNLFHRLALVPKPNHCLAPDPLDRIGHGDKAIDSAGNADDHFG